MAHAHDDLLNAAPAGFLSFRDDGAIVAVNATLLELLGYERDDLLGRHVEQILGVAGRIFYQTHLFPLVRMHGRAEEIYLEFRSRDGTSLPMLLNARRAELDGAPVTHCVVIRVRERKKYEDELLRAKKAAEAARADAVEANRAKSHYLRSVSHEIRTPINALLGYADLLELGAGAPMGEKQLEYVGRVRHAARHLLTLVNDILDLAKIEAGAMTLARAPADIAAAADAALAMIEPQAREQNVRLVRPQPAAVGGGDRSARSNGGDGGGNGNGNGNGGAGGGAPPPSRYIGDHERVVQILLNLLSNAVKFTEPGGRVELAWEAASEPDERSVLNGGGPWLRIRVTDTGVGIAPDRLDELFQPFRQITEPGQESRPGTGLGLTISRELARLMDGDITVRSQPGEGSTFSLWLRAED